MIPLHDHSPSGKTPVITNLIIAINILVFLYMFFLPDENALVAFINAYALIPAQIISGHHLITLITSMFIHGGIGHIAGNMWFLHLTGDNLEARMGSIKYAFFYIMCGLGASMLQILVDPTSTIPVLGASGAIAGLMGGYLILFPFNQVDILFKSGPFLESGTVPAFALLIYWFVAQLFSGAGSIVSGVETGGVAYSAHVGGFIAGIIATNIFKNKIEKSSL